MRFQEFIIRLFCFLPCSNVINRIHGKAFTDNFTDPKKAPRFINSRQQSASIKSTNIEMEQETTSIRGSQNLIARLKKLRKNQYFQAVSVILLIVAVVLGFWFGSQIILNTKITPALAVVSGSMCIPYDGVCDGWTHPFDRTLHIGDLIII